MSDLVTTTKGQIQRIVPFAKNVLIKLQREHNLYRSKIHVNVPGAVLHADKKAPTAWEALELSYQAILKQVDRIKSKKERRRMPKVWRWQTPDLP